MKLKLFKVSILIILLVLLIGFVSATNETNENDNQNNIIEKNFVEYEHDSTKSLNYSASTRINVNDISDTCYTDNATISGSLEDDQGNYLKNTPLNININGADYKSITNTDGHFNINYRTRIIGNNNVTVSFKENGDFKGSESKTSFVVTPQVTVLSLNNIPDTMFSDVVNINGNYKDKNNVTLRFTPISISINNQKFVTYTDANGHYSYDYKTITAGINNIRVSYQGNARYQKDTVDSSFKVIPKTTGITVNNIAPCQYNEFIYVTGRYADNDGNNLRYTPLILTYNNNRVINNTNSEGLFTFKIKTVQVGNNTLSISYPGNARYAGTVTYKTFNVSPKDTVLHVNKINDTEYLDYVVISGKYTDCDGNNLRYTPLDIELNNRKYQVSTDANGLFKYKIKTNSVGTNQGKIYFKGNVRYNTATEYLVFNVTSKSTNIQLTPYINNSYLFINGRFTDINGSRLRYTPLNLEISYKNRYVNSGVILKTAVSTDNDGFFNYKYKIDNPGIYSSKVSYNGNLRYKANSTTVSTIEKGESNIFVNSLQGIVNRTTTLEVNVTDELNNSVTTGKIDLYLNNRLLLTKNVTTPKSTLYIAPQKIGVYDLKVVYSSDYYRSTSKVVKLSVNPNSNYNIKLLWNPSITRNYLTKISAHIRNKNNNNTLNKGQVKFYLNKNYLGCENVKNNLSAVRFNVTYASGYYTAQADYYVDNKFVGSASELIYVKNPDTQISQNTFITLSSDIINNSKITSAKKDVYFAMDRTTSSDNNYSPNDMKIMNGIANNLRANGFNVKTIRNGPGETYNTAKYMYNHNIKNSICFILCNGVDANVIREYLYGNDGYITTVRKRGNDIVMGWFYGAGNIYDSDGEYYYYLKKAWDDNYSGKGGISNPRKTMEKDGIKIVYERNDLTGRDVANSFIKLYGGKVTEKIAKNTVVSLKTTLYNTNNEKITKGNIVYTLNGKVINNVSITSNSFTFKYKLPNISGTYNLKATYYLNNKVICQTWDRYIKVL